MKDTKTGSRDTSLGSLILGVRTDSARGAWAAGSGIQFGEMLHRRPSSASDVLTAKPDTSVNS